MKMRSPILVALGHVDHGKTTLLDKIRGSDVARTEPGLITQYISASYIPTNTIRQRCGPLLDRLGITLNIPGILWMDSPGHEAFTTLRKRGGAIADFAVLVVDLMEGFQPQTRESVNFLRQFKTPFCVALTKIDRLVGWVPRPGEPFVASFEDQSSRTKEAFDDKFYRIIGELGREGFSAERFDRVEDFTKQIAIVPLSGTTGEGVPDLLVIIAGIAQRFLKGSLEVQPGKGKGTVLEVKEVVGLGSTIDAIIYDGSVRRGDFLVVGGNDLVRSRVKALLVPAPLKELRMEKGFQPADEIAAAAGVRIAGPGLEFVLAGSPFRVVKSEKEVTAAEDEVREEVEEVEFASAQDGAILRADTLGSLEALIKTLQPVVPIRKAGVGTVTRADVLEAKTLGRPIFAFGTKRLPDIEKFAKDNQVALFASDIIYAMVEDYQTWELGAKERSLQHILDSVPRPGQVAVLRGFLFRQKDPAVFGVEVVKGTIRPGVVLVNKGKKIGEVKEIQDQGESRPEAVKGQRIAISMPDVVFGKQVNEGNVLEVFLSEATREALEKARSKLRLDERELLDAAGF
ncbi:MAG: translation initiation factor IF-2 [Candidatus Aenigmarchaeota archaeon]|nr:translation initiation factor IF-2 [Candidatus Aenigmarchaeota archaeon]